MASSVILACLNAITEDALLSAWGVAGIATPLTHLAGVALCRPKEAGAASAGSASDRRPGASLAFVVSGGPRHIVLQALSFVSAGLAWGGQARAALAERAVSLTAACLRALVRSQTWQLAAAGESRSAVTPPRRPYGCVRCSWPCRCCTRAGSRSPRRRTRRCCPRRWRSRRTARCCSSSRRCELAGCALRRPPAGKPSAGNARAPPRLTLAHCVQAGV